MAHEFILRRSLVADSMRNTLRSRSVTRAIVILDLPAKGNLILSTELVEISCLIWTGNKVFVFTKVEATLFRYLPCKSLNHENAKAFSQGGTPGNLVTSFRVVLCANVYAIASVSAESSYPESLFSLPDFKRIVCHLQPHNRQRTTGCHGRG